MLDQLRFVAGAISRKDLIPAMSHFVIQDGFARSYNGALALCAPIPFSLNCKPKAAPLIHAIDKCTETIQLSMTAAGKLRINSGPFKAYIDCIDEDAFHVQPEGQEILFDGKALLDALEVLEPFIGDDASRQWSNGVLLKGHSAFATNNVIAVEYWLGDTELPFEVNVPKAAITEMLRIGEPPLTAQLDKNSISFHYADKRWIRSQLLDVAWPDINHILGGKNDAKPIDARLFPALDSLKPFTDKIGRVYISSNCIRTITDENDEQGASVELTGITWSGIYQIDMLKLLDGVATLADFDLYPSPCIFYGNRIRGAIVGMKM